MQYYVYYKDYYRSFRYRGEAMDYCDNHNIPFWAIYRY